MEKKRLLILVISVICCLSLEAQNNNVSSIIEQLNKNIPHNTSGKAVALSKFVYDNDVLSIILNVSPENKNFKSFSLLMQSNREVEFNTWRKLSILQELYNALPSSTGMKIRYNSINGNESFEFLYSPEEVVQGFANPEGKAVVGKRYINAFIDFINSEIHNYPVVSGYKVGEMYLSVDGLIQTYVCENSKSFKSFSSLNQSWEGKQAIIQILKSQYPQLLRSLIDANINYIMLIQLEGSDKQTTIEYSVSELIKLSI